MIKTLSNLNTRHRKFWDEQNRLCDERLADPPLRKMALARITDEYRRSVPARSQATLELALQQAEENRRVVLSDQGRLGRAKRPKDALTIFIEAQVRQTPLISERDLLQDFRRRAGAPDTVIAVDDEDIIYCDSQGKEHKAPIAGLKDRLSRAKKLARSSR